MSKWAVLAILLSVSCFGQLVTVLPPQSTVNTAVPPADLTHLAAATANGVCNGAPAVPNTYCAPHQSTPAASGALIWNPIGGAANPATPGGPLDKCINDIQGTGAGVPTNGCVIVLDAGFSYATPLGFLPPQSFGYVFHDCSANLTFDGYGCHGLMPPVIQTNANYLANTPQYIYFVSTQWGAVPARGTRVNPSGAIGAAGDGFSHPLNLTSNINNTTQMAAITQIADATGQGMLFFGNGPMYYHFDGIELLGTSTLAQHITTGSFNTNGYTYQGVVLMGEGQTGARPLHITSHTGGSFATYKDAALTVLTKTPWLPFCHINSPTGPNCNSSVNALNGVNNLLKPATNYTIFIDGYNTHMVAGQSQIQFTWQSRQMLNALGLDPDVTVNALPSGGTKYAIDHCLAGATNSGNGVLGNICVVDTSFMCDGVTAGQCAKVQIQIAQNASTSSCSSAHGTAPTLNGNANCYNSGDHTFMIDTVPSAAPSNCFGPGTATANGSDCSSIWAGGGNWAAGTERAMTMNWIQVAFDSTQTPQVAITSCTDTTLSTPCIQSPIDNAQIFPATADNYSVVYTGHNTSWLSTQVINTGITNHLESATTYTVNVPSQTITVTFKALIPANFSFITSRSIGGYDPGSGANAVFANNPRFQNPTAEMDQINQAFDRISASSSPFYGIDFCSMPIGDGSLGPQYTRQTFNYVARGREAVIRCFLLPNGTAFSTAGFACSTGPCPNSYQTLGLDFGADIVIDSVAVVNSTTLDITVFPCDGSTHPGCTPQISADMGAVGTRFSHIYGHGSGNVLHTGIAPDPGPAGSPCAGSRILAANSNWHCYMDQGEEFQAFFQFNGSNISVEDSFLDNIWACLYNGAGHPPCTVPDNQVFAVLAGSGPMLIKNNFISAGTENILSGGGGSVIGQSANTSPCDLQIFNNYIYKPPWWYNGAIGLQDTTQTVNHVISIKNLREQKSGCRWEYANNIMDWKWEGVIPGYNSFNLSVRGDFGPCCDYQTDIYSHDNINLNNNKFLEMSGVDGQVRIGYDTNNSFGVYAPLEMLRLYMYNELQLSNQNESSVEISIPPATGTSTPPLMISSQWGLRSMALNHVTFTLQDGISSPNALGGNFQATGPDVFGNTCPNGGTNGRATNGPMGRPSNNWWMLNSVFFSGYGASAACDQVSWAGIPSLSPNDVAHRWAGNVFPKPQGTLYVTATPPNFTGVAGTNPTPFLTFAKPVPYTYDIDASVGFAGDYTLTGNATGGTVTSQLLGNWIGPSAPNTTDGLTAGVIMPRLLAATQFTVTGVPVLQLNILTQSPLPLCAVGENCNDQLAASSPNGTCNVTPGYTCTWTLTGTLPAGLSLNTSTGLISGTPTTSGTGSFSITVTDGTLTSPTTPFQLPVNPRLTAAATSLPAGTVNIAGYSASLSFTGGVPPYQWQPIANATGGSFVGLPPGLSFNQASGAITGTPTRAGTFAFTGQITDANITNCTGANAPACHSYSIQIANPMQYVSPTSIPNMTQNVAITPITVTVTGNIGAITCSLLSGAFPAGVALGGTGNCTISGTPTVVGNFSVNIQVKDSASPIPQTVSSGDLSFSVQTPIFPLVVTTTSCPLAAIGFPYNCALNATGGLPPWVLWRVVSGTLPVGLSIKGSGTAWFITGIPTVLGTSSFVVQVKDTAGTVANSGSLSIAVVTIAGSNVGGNSAVNGVVK